MEIGRDRFFELLAEKDLLVLPKVGRPRTTHSRHSLPVFHNLMAGKRSTGPFGGVASTDAGMVRRPLVRPFWLLAMGLVMVVAVFVWLRVNLSWRKSEVGISNSRKKSERQMRKTRNGR